MSDLSEIYKPSMYQTQLEIAHELTKSQIPFIVLPLKEDGSDFLALLSVATDRLERLTKDG